MHYGEDLGKHLCVSEHIPKPAEEPLSHWAMVRPLSAGYVNTVVHAKYQIYISYDPQWSRTGEVM